jgi:hypothetical protein
MSSAWPKAQGADALHAGGLLFVGQNGGHVGFNEAGPRRR